MTVTIQSLADLDSHWAVESVDPSDRKAAFDFGVNSFVAASVGDYIELPRRDDAAGIQSVERVAMAYEIAAMEGLPALVAPFATEDTQALRAQAQAAAYRAFELRRIIPPPLDYAQRLFAVLRLAALAYSSDRWTDLRRWLDDIETEAPTGDGEPNWDAQLLATLFECWMRLLRKRGWDDLSKVAGYIADLRSRQSDLEPELLRAAGGNRESVALRLVALYHWAKATEVLGVYMTMGTVKDGGDVNSVLSQHLDSARRAAREAGELEFELLLRWLEATARKMADNSVWRAAGRPASRQFVERLAKSQSVLEFLPPQRVALQEQGLLDPERRAVVVDLPTSGGKTTLAEFRMLQALNLFRDDDGWVAYVAPTRALVAQVTRRLRNDLGPLGVVVEQLSAAVDIDAFEQTMLDTEPFHVLIATPEKLDLLIRNGQVRRPLALVVVDEAHNIEDKSRGLRLELLLANIKRDRAEANFLLLMPYVSNAQDLARWLAPESGTSISLGTAAWQPNERLVGIYWTEREPSGRGDWSLRFEGLTTSARTVDLKGVHKVGGVRPLAMPWSEATSLTKTTAAIARVMSARGTSIAVARTIRDCWAMARAIHDALDTPLEPSEEIALVQRFLATEVSPDFELIELLGSGIGVHHAGLSDDARSLIEWLAEIQALRVLCATTTISQGINFPVSSVFLATRLLPVRGSEEMSHRAFWNLAGRAGRVGHDSLGMVGLAAGENPDAVRRYVSDATGALVSRLEQLLDEIETAGRLSDLPSIVHGEDWTDFRSYVAHLWNEKKNLDAVLSSTEQLLRSTFGYGSLDAQGARGEAKANALLGATRAYATELAEHPENAVLADSTGFSPDGVRTALLELRNGPQLSISDWTPDSLFGGGTNSALAGLVGVMMKVPQLNQLRDLVVGHGDDRGKVAAVAQAWVNGESLESIAKEYFADEHTSLTDAITNACRGVYRTLGNAGSWGLSALSKLPTAGIPHADLSEEQLRQLNLLPAMIYHGVRSEAGVLMRMNSVPRSVAEPLGDRFVASRAHGAPAPTPQLAREFVSALKDADWEAASPGASLSGSDYRVIWRRLSGESA